MRESVLAVLIAAVIVLTFVGQQFLAILIGFVGALALIMSGEGGKRSFEPVEVPPAGGYPGWDFWKGALENMGALTGSVLKTAMKIDVPIDMWSDFWKEKVWKKGKGTSEWIIPGLMEKVDKNVYLLKMIMEPVERMEVTLQNMYARAPDSEKKKIEKALAKVFALKMEMLKFAKEGKIEKLVEKDKEFKKMLKEIEEILSQSGDQGGGKDVI